MKLVYFSGGNAKGYNAGHGRYTWLGQQLLAAKVQTSPTAWQTYIPAYDGNHNVIKLIEVATGNVGAECEYSPYGKVTKAIGPAVLNNLIRFSSEFYDDITGLINYGFRHYSPQTHRWLSKDPIGYAGGLNLYGFVGGDPVNGVDTLGLCPLANPMNADAWGNPENLDPKSLEGLETGLESWAKDFAYGLANLAAASGDMEFDYDGSKFEQMQDVQQALAESYAASEEDIMRRIQDMPPGQQMVAIWTPFGIDFVLVVIPATDAPNMAKGIVGLGRSGPLLEDAVTLERNLAKLEKPKLDPPTPKPSGTPKLSEVECPKPPLRLEYEEKVKDLAKKLEDLRSQGKSWEDIARQLSAERRQIGIDYKDMTPPDMLEAIYKGNIEDYGDPIGPTIEWFQQMGYSWERIARGATKPGPWPPKRFKLPEK